MVSSTPFPRLVPSMEYAKRDNGGNDDDLSMQHVNQASKGARFSGAFKTPSMTIPYGTGLSDMEFQIHCIEREAYSAVLRAFVAQSEVLSWDKEGLISELRKELRVSDVEHREILVKVDSDDSIKTIREWRNNIAIQQEMLSNTVSPHKTFKTAKLTMSSPPKYLSRVQPSPASLPSLTAHCRDNQRGDDTAVFAIQGNVGQGLKSTMLDKQAPSLGKRRLSLVLRSKANFPSPSIDGFKRGSDTIDILVTDKLIPEIERVFREENPDRAQMERAKLILREHERALVKALEKIGDVSDGDDSPTHLKQHYSNEAAQRTRHGNYHPTFEQVDRMRGCIPEGFHGARATQSGIPYIIEDKYGDDYS